MEAFFCVVALGCILLVFSISVSRIWNERMLLRGGHRGATFETDGEFAYRFEAGCSRRDASLSENENAPCTKANDSDASIHVRQYTFAGDIVWRVDCAFSYAVSAGRVRLLLNGYIVRDALFVMPPGVNGEWTRLSWGHRAKVRPGITVHSFLLTNGRFGTYMCELSSRTCEGVRRTGAFVPQSELIEAPQPSAGSSGKRSVLSCRLALADVARTDETYSVAWYFTDGGTTEHNEEWTGSWRGEPVCELKVNAGNKGLASRVRGHRYCEGGVGERVVDAKLLVAPVAEDFGVYTCEIRRSGWTDARQIVLVPHIRLEVWRGRALCEASVPVNERTALRWWVDDERWLVPVHGVMREPNAVRWAVDTGEAVAHVCELGVVGNMSLKVTQLKGTHVVLEVNGELGNRELGCGVKPMGHLEFFIRSGRGMTGVWAVE